MSLFVVLSQKWESRALEGAHLRQRFAEARNLEHFGGRQMTLERALDNHIVGCRSECAVAKILQLPWSAQAGVLTGIDVGGKVEVRARRMPSRHRDLAFRPTRDKQDKDHLPFVLVYVHGDGRLEIIGWLYGHEARARGGECHYQICYVPGPYRSVESLIETFGLQQEKIAA